MPIELHRETSFPGFMQQPDFNPTQRDEDDVSTITYTSNCDFTWVIIYYIGLGTISRVPVEKE